MQRSALPFGRAERFLSRAAEKVRDKSRRIVESNR